MFSVNRLFFCVIALLSLLQGACVKGLPEKTLIAFIESNKELLAENNIDLSPYALKNGNILYEGSEIEPISFKTLFHEAAAMRFDSLDFANTVMDSYRSMGAFYMNGMDHFRGGYVLSKEAFFLFSRASSKDRLVDYHQYFLQSGSQERFSNTLGKVANVMQQTYPGLTHRKGGKVVVLTGPYGGGHESAAGAIEQALAPEFGVTLLNVCDYEAKGLFYNILNRDIKICEVYKKVQLREGNSSKAQILTFLGETIRRYELTDMWMRLSDAIRKEKPSLIISTIHHIPQATWVAMMAKVPLRIMITDYDSPHTQSPLINFYDPKEVKLWVPSESANQFTSVEAYVEKELRSREFGRTKILMDRVIRGRERLPSVEKDLEIFEFQPFPLFSEFLKSESIAEWRTHLGLSAETDRKTIALMYGSGAGGSAPVEALQSLLRALDDVDGSFEVLFLTTSNQKLQEEARRIVRERGEALVHFQGESLANSMPSQKSVVVLYDTLDRQSMMPAVYGASSMVFTKPGGATVAELLGMERFLIPVFPVFPWEMGNLAFLQEVGLAPEGLPLERGALSVSELVEIINRQLREPRALRDMPQAFSAQHFRDRVRSLVRKSGL